MGMHCKVRNSLKTLFWLVGLTACSQAQETIADDRAVPHEQSVQSGREGELTSELNVVYGQETEPMHRADLYRFPQKNGAAKSPAVIMIHGGAWITGDKRNDTLHAKRLAKLGMLVMSINYRLAPQHAYPAQIDDCYLALEWLNSNADRLGVDTDAIGAWGYSAGGHLCALLATDPKLGLPRIKACVVGAAPSDLSQVPKDSQLLVGLFRGTRSEFPQRYVDASPVHHVSPDDPPVFLFHGSKDWLVPPKESEYLRSALEKNRVPFEYVVVPNKAHLMTFVDFAIADRSFEFLQKQLVPNPSSTR